MKTALQHHRENGPATNRAPLLRAAPIFAAVLVAAGSLITPAQAADAASQKMLRQIGVMEKIIDKVLVDSPNVLVSGMGNTRGLYVDPYGVVLTFTGSILRGDSPLAPLSEAWSFGTGKDQYEISTDEDGNQVITIKKKGKKDTDKDKSEAEVSASADADKDSDDAVWQTARAKKYEAAKAELIQAILDYGETITALKTGQNLLVAGFMRDDDFFREEKISRFVLSAKVDDLRAFSSGDLTEAAMRAKIRIEEY